MTTKNKPTTALVDLRPLYSELGEVKKAQEGIMHDLSTQSSFSDKILAAVYLANGGRPSSGQNKAEAGLAPQDFAAFNAGGFFSPANPILPVVPEFEPRQFQYAPGINLRFIPRSGYGLLDFATLRGLSLACKEIRLNIEKIKSTIRGLEHEIVVDKKYATANGIDYQANPKLVDPISLFWEKPDGLHDFDGFINMVLEELLVTDALCVWPIPEENRLRLIDGTTIRPTTDYFGEIPMPPTPAYIQVLYGYPRWWSDRKHMYYLPMRTSLFSPYGTSPIEFIIQSTIAAIKKDSSLVSNYTEGNVPAAFAGLPSTWTPDQIQQFTEWYNTIIQGDVARRHKLVFLPHDSGGMPVQRMDETDLNDTKLDEWLMTVACWAYGNDKTEFGIVSGSGLGGKGMMQGGENAQVRGMIQVYTEFLSKFINAINRDVLNAPFAKSHWIGLEPPEDELVTAQVHQIYVGTIYTADYVADQLGIPQKYRVQPGQTMPVTPEGYKVDTTKVIPKTPDEIAQVAKTQLRAVKYDLENWRDRVIFEYKKGIPLEDFPDTIMPDWMRKSVFEKIKASKTPEEVKLIFSDLIKDLPNELAKKMTHPAIDPNQHVKDAAAIETQAALKVWLDGVRHRIVSKVVTEK